MFNQVCWDGVLSRSFMVSGSFYCVSQLLYFNLWGSFLRCDLDLSRSCIVSIQFFYIFHPDLFCFLIIHAVFCIFASHIRNSASSFLVTVHHLLNFGMHFSVIMFCFELFYLMTFLCIPLAFGYCAHFLDVFIQPHVFATGSVCPSLLHQI